MVKTFLALCLAFVAGRASKEFDPKEVTATADAGDSHASSQSKFKTQFCRHILNDSRRINLVITTPFDSLALGENRTAMKIGHGSVSVREDVLTEVLFLAHSPLKVAQDCAEVVLSWNDRKPLHRVGA